MTELRAIGAIILLLLACLMVVMNWTCVIASERNRRKGIQKHVSTVPLLSLIFAGFAHTLYPWTPKGWIGFIPAVDMGNWMLVIGLPWAIAKGMFKKGTPNQASEATSGSAPGAPPEAPQG